MSNVHHEFCAFFLLYDKNCWISLGLFIASYIMLLWDFLCYIMQWLLYRIRFLSSLYVLCYVLVIRLFLAVILYIAISSTTYLVICRHHSLCKCAVIPYDVNVQLSLITSMCSCPLLCKCTVVPYYVNVQLSLLT